MRLRNDGDLDLLLENSYEPIRLFINHAGEANRSAKFDVVGSGPSRFAIGANIDVRTGGDWQVREVIAGSNYKGQNELVQHFGLGSAAVMDEVVVLWPGGATRTLYDLLANQTWTLYPTDKLGDGDNDGDRNIDDFVIFAGCYDVPFVSDCEMMDFHGSGAVDLAILLGNWGLSSPPPPCLADFDGDGQVGAADLAQLLGFWGVVDGAEDTEGDGVQDACDICPGFDDHVDSDGNGVPDGCCDFETDCELGEVCERDGFCVPASGPDLEIGVGGGAFACIDGPYTKLAHGGALTVCEGFQGIIEMWVSLRLTGFAPDADVEVTRSVSLAEHPCVDAEDCDTQQECLEGYCTPFGVGPTLLPLTDAGDGVNELFGFLYMIFLSADDLDGQEIIISMSVADQTDPSITASLDLNVVVTVARFCFGDEYCPAGQTCVDGYCERM